MQDGSGSVLSSPHAVDFLLLMQCLTRTLCARLSCEYCVTLIQLSIYFTLASGSPGDIPENLCVRKLRL